MPLHSLFPLALSSSSWTAMEWTWTGVSWWEVINTQSGINIKWACLLLAFCLLLLWRSLLLLLSMCAWLPAGVLKIDAQPSPSRRLPPPFCKLGLAGRLTLCPSNLTPVRFHTHGCGGLKSYSYAWRVRTGCSLFKRSSCSLVDGLQQPVEPSVWYKDVDSKNISYSWQ